MELTNREKGHIVYRRTFMRLDKLLGPWGFATLALFILGMVIFLTSLNWKPLTTIYNLPGGQQLTIDASGAHIGDLIIHQANQQPPYFTPWVIVGLVVAGVAALICFSLGLYQIHLAKEASRNYINTL